MTVRKGVVMDKGAGWAIILMPDGEFRKIKTNQYLEIGELYQEKAASPVKYAAAAVILLAVLLSTIDYFSVQAYARVSNLAELGVNRWGRVISVQAVNDEGKHILDTVDLKNDKLSSAVEKICAQSQPQDVNPMDAAKRPLISVISKDGAKPELEEKMLKQMDLGLQKAMQIHERHEFRRDRLEETMENRLEEREDQEKLPEPKELVIPGKKPDGHLPKKDIENRLKEIDDQTQTIKPEIEKGLEENDHVTPVIDQLKDKTEPLVQPDQEIITPPPINDSISEHKKLNNNDLKEKLEKEKEQFKQNYLKKEIDTDEP